MFVLLRWLQYFYSHHAKVFRLWAIHTSHKGLILEMVWFFCIANMILDSELLLIFIILSIIFWPLVPVSHLDTFRHCIIVVFRAYERAAQHIIIYTPPPAVWGCRNVRIQYTVAQPFRTSFCLQTTDQNELHLKHIEAWSI